MDSYVSFPNLGWKFFVEEEIVSFPFFNTEITLRWYGLLIAIGFTLAIVYGFRNAKRFGIQKDPMLDVILVCTVMAFIGARLYYVVFSEDRATYFANPLSILRIWEGGLAIYGGVIFAFLSAIFMCRWRKVDTLRMFDLAAICFPIGQAIGRWGNFFNQEAYGSNTTLPWGMMGSWISSPANPLSGYDHSLPVHPTFLYESLWCILAFVLLHWMSRKAYKFKGQLFCTYVMWYGTGRFFIEQLRTDSLPFFTMRISCVVALLSVIGAAFLYMYLKRRAVRLAEEAEDVGSTLAVEMPVAENFEEEALKTEEQQDGAEN